MIGRKLGANFRTCSRRLVDRLLRFAFGVCVCALLLVQTGCFETDFTYGKAGDKSVNGVSVFTNLLRDRGHTVSRARRLSKRTERYDTIFWAPDNSTLPPENVVAWLEDWLSRGKPRVVIYVGRSYDGKADFYRGKVESASPDARENWQRELGDVLIDDNQVVDWRATIGATDEPWWFEQSEEVATELDDLGGPWAKDIDSSAVEIECSSLLKPLDDYSDPERQPELVIDFGAGDKGSHFFSDEMFREHGLEVKELLTVDGQPFAFEISSSQSKSGSKLIVISNGSFLLNYPLLYPENRKLASRVADEVVGDVVVLESGWTWPRIGGAANDPALRWTWIGQAPMNYIVPHFLFWGVLYCFVFFPNFGRPKRIQFHPPKAFRSHVKAVGSILGRSKEKSWARSMVDTWLQRNKTKS
jgi:hypothetical protein